MATPQEDMAEVPENSLGASAQNLSSSGPMVASNVLVAVIANGYVNIPNVDPLSYERDTRGILMAFHVGFGYDALYYDSESKRKLLQKNWQDSVEAQKEKVRQLKFKERWNQVDYRGFTGHVRDCVSAGNYDGLIFVVSAHGTQGPLGMSGICTCDGQVYFVRSFRDYFSDDKCPKLAGKLRLFVFDMCRGSTKLPPAPKSLRIEIQKSSKRKQAPNKPKKDELVEAVVEQKEDMQNEPEMQNAQSQVRLESALDAMEGNDLFICVFSTQDSMTSIESPQKKGGILIRAIRQVFDKVHTKDTMKEKHALDNLLAEVGNVVLALSAKDTQYKKMQTMDAQHFHTKIHLKPKARQQNEIMLEEEEKKESLDMAQMQKKQSDSLSSLGKDSIDSDAANVNRGPVCKKVLVAMMCIGRYGNKYSLPGIERDYSHILPLFYNRYRYDIMFGVNEDDTHDKTRTLYFTQHTFSPDFSSMSYKTAWNKFEVAEFFEDVQRVLQIGKYEGLFLFLSGRSYPDERVFFCTDGSSVSLDSLRDKFMRELPAFREKPTMIVIDGYSCSFDEDAAKKKFYDSSYKAPYHQSLASTVELKKGKADDVDLITVNNYLSFLFLSIKSSDDTTENGVGIGRNTEGGRLLQSFPRVFQRAPVLQEDVDALGLTFNEIVAKIDADFRGHNDIIDEKARLLLKQAAKTRVQVQENEAIQQTGCNVM